MNFDRITGIFGSFYHYRVWDLFNHSLLQFSVDLFQNVHTCCGCNENMHVCFWLRIK